MSEQSARPTLDLTKTIGELVSADPSLTESLTDIGFEDLPSDKTIPELSRAAGVETSVVALALEAFGYDVQNFESDDDFVNPLPEILGRFFSPDDGETPVMSEGTDSASTLVSHMEDAIRRAQEKGNLPA